MPFQNPTIDAGLWRGPDIAGGLLGGYLNMQRARLNDAAAADFQAQADQRRQALDEDRNWQRAVQANPGEQGLAALYGVNTGRAMEYEKGLRELQNLRAQGGKLYQEGRKTSTEADKADTDLVNSEAIGAAHLLGALPPDQRTMQTLAPFLMSRAGFYRSTRPDIAAKLEQAAQSPDSITHIMAVAKGAGYKDPNEDMQRDLYKSNAQAQFQNQLPPTPYQQQQLGLQQQSTQAELGNKANERANALRKQFEALEEVQTYRTVAPLLQGLYSSARLNNKAGDLGLIYGVARVLDPKGVVRESDAGLVGGTGAWFEQLAGQYDAVKGGAMLSPDVRAKLLEMAEGKTQALKGAYDVARDQYAGIAQRQGIARDDMAFETMPLGGQPPAPQAAPQQSGGAFREGQTATNKQTGARMIYRGGQWQPL